MTARSEWNGFLARGVVILGLAGFIPGGAAAQAATGLDLARLYDPGFLLVDTNGDSVPDAVNATLLLPAEPTVTELRAAAEVAARLGFETMGVDLPVSRGLDGSRIPIVIGARAAARFGVPVDTTGGAAGTGRVTVEEHDGRPWVIVLGPDDAGLMHAARALAGSLPHTRTLSTPHLDDIGEAIRVVLDSAGTTGATATVRFTAASTGDFAAGLQRVVAHVTVPPGGVAAARAALAERADAPDSTRWTFTGLETLAIQLNGQPAAVLEVAAEPPPPGPVPGRPGAGAKGDLDLSNLFTPSGLLGDGDNNLIPDRIDVLLVPGDSAVGGLPDLAARLGLESTGFTLPLTRSAGEIERPASQPTMVLAGRAHPLIERLADSGAVPLDSLGPGEGLVQLVPDAFGAKSALVLTGGDRAGADRALRQVAETFPHLAARGADRPTVDDVEHALWGTLSGHTRGGQAAIGLYKLDRIVADLAGRDVDSLHVLLSVEGASSGLDSVIRDRVAGLEARRVGVTVENRDVSFAPVLIDERWTVPSEVDAFRTRVREEVLPAVRTGDAVRIEARLSESPAVRERLAAAVRRELIARGADPEQTRVTVLSAFKQGYFWLDEIVRPQLEGREVGEIVIRFRKNDPPEAWPQQAMHTPLRWLHEIFPIDEILARALSLDLEQIRFEMAEEGPTYEVRVTDRGGRTLLTDTFEPRWVLRPYFDRFRDYEHVRVSTGWLEVHRNGQMLVSDRIVTDPETFWDWYQDAILPAVYDYVMDRHDGLPRGGGRDAPFFGQLTVELELSEPDYLLGIDKELISPMDAVHEEVYFGTIEFFHLLGRNARGQDLTYPGRVIPVMIPRDDGRPGRAQVRFSGFATNRPAVLVTWRDAAGARHEERLDIPKVDMERPSAVAARVHADAPGVSRLDLRVRVDSERDLRDSLLRLAPPLQVDERMISAEQVRATLANLGALRRAGMYDSSLAWPGLGELVVHAGWTHDPDPDSTVRIALAPNGAPAPPPDWRTLLPAGWTYAGERLVQWETPIPPPEGHEVLAKFAAAFDEARLYRAGRSYLGKDIWAMDLMPPVTTSHWSYAKATTFKPTVIYSARQHANEVSSTSHVLRHAELLLTDSEQRRKLDRVNVVIHPFTNPDGAQLAYDLYTVTPEFILHAGYLGALGMDATSGGNSDFPIYPESKVRGRLWDAWLPDIFLNPHGYPSHQVVQLFSEYQGLVRRGRVTERNWGFNKGWFMPGFGYVDDPRYPRHRDAAFTIRDYITRGINAHPDVVAMNHRNYARYDRYGARFDPDVFRIPLVDSVLIQMPLEGSAGRTGGPGFNSRVTIWSGTTEAPDETAHGPWMELVATAGLAWDQAILDYLADGNHEVERSGSAFFGGISLKMHRPRPPKPPEEPDDEKATAPPAGQGR